MGEIAVVSGHEAEDFDLCTLGAVKAELGLTADTNDQALAERIRQASAAIARYTGRCWAEQRYEENVPGYGDTELQVTHCPLVGDVHGVVMNSSPVTGWEIRDREAGVLYLSTGWTWTAVVGWGFTGHYVPRSEDPAFAVTYTAGYWLPNWVGAKTDDGASPPVVISENLPADIVRACVLTVKEWWLSKDERASVTSKKIGPLAVTYAKGDDAAHGLPLTATALLPLPRIV